MGQILCTFHKSSWSYLLHIIAGFYFSMMVVVLPLVFLLGTKWAWNGCWNYFKIWAKIRVYKGPGKGNAPDPYITPNKGHPKKQCQGGSIFESWDQKGLRNFEWYSPLQLQSAMQLNTTLHVSNTCDEIAYTYTLVVTAQLSVPSSFLSTWNGDDLWNAAYNVLIIARLHSLVIKAYSINPEA